MEEGFELTREEIQRLEEKYPEVGKKLRNLFYSFQKDIAKMDKGASLNKKKVIAGHVLFELTAMLYLMYEDNLPVMLRSIEAQYYTIKAGLLVRESKKMASERTSVKNVIAS